MGRLRGAVAGREVNGRHHTAGHAGQHRQADRDGERQRIDARILQQRHAERLKAGQRVRRPHRHRNADDRSGKCEEQAFGERLLNQVASRGADGHADGEFLAARVDPREQQIGEVDAGNREDTPDCARQHEESRPESAAQSVVQRRDPRAKRTAVVDRFLESLADRLQIGLGLLHRHARLQPPDTKHGVAPPCRLRADGKWGQQVDFVAGRKNRVEIERRR